MAHRASVLFAALSLGVSLPCAAQVRAAAPSAASALMARSAGVMTSFFAAPAPDVASVAGVLHIAGKLTTAEAAALAPAARDGAAGLLRSAAPGLKSEAAGARLAVLMHKPVFALLTEGQKTAVKRAALGRDAELRPQSRRLHAILRRITDRLDWTPAYDQAQIPVHLPDGSMYYRPRSGLTKPK